MKCTSVFFSLMFETRLFNIKLLIAVGGTASSKGDFFCVP